jgi:hypothetical protein
MKKMKREMEGKGEERETILTRYFRFLPQMTGYAP